MPRDVVGQEIQTQQLQLAGDSIVVVVEVVDPDQADRQYAADGWELLTM